MLRFRGVYRLFVIALIVSTATHSTVPRPAVAMKTALARLPLLFVPNRGQADEGATFLASGDKRSVLFGQRGLSIRLTTPPPRADESCADTDTFRDCLGEWTAPPAPDPLAPMKAGERRGNEAAGTVDAVTLRWLGARPGVLPVPEARSETRVSLFRGPRARWLTGMPTFGRLVYRDLWPGIDLVFEGGPRQIKHTFIVRPGADPVAIRLAWEGVRGIHLDGQGALVVDTTAGPLVDAAPVAWQEIAGRRVPVAAAYQIAGPGKSEAAYGISLGPWDRRATLVIDPAMVVSASFVGSADYDRGLGVAVDSSGAIYLCGTQGGARGGAAFVAKLDPSGTRLLWLALLDGNSSDQAFDVAVDARGSAVVTGSTHSADGSFPVSGGPDLSFNGGSSDGFVARLAPSGEGLEWSGFFGGAGIEFGEGVVIDRAGNVTLTGVAESSEASFPVVVGPDLSQNGGFDAWVGRLRPVPTAASVVDNYLWSGFIGGAGDDVLNRPGQGGIAWSSGHVALDAAGNAYISGETDSDETTFPDGDGFGALPAPGRTYNGNTDAWVAKVKADGSGLDYAGYIGGRETDRGKGMAVDAQGAAWLTGSTGSDERSFPVVEGPGLVYGGQRDAFLAKVKPDGTGLEQCGYVGGDDVDGGQAVALSADGTVIVVGFTESNQDYFPVVGGPDLSHNGPDGLDNAADEYDAFVGRLRPGVRSSDPRRHWDFLGFIGGRGNDSAYWAAVAPSGRIVVVGDTTSDEATFPTGGGLANLPGLGEPNHGSVDAFVAVVEWHTPAPRIYLPWAGRDADRSDPTASSEALPSPSPSTTRLPTTTSQPTATATPTWRVPTRSVGPGEELVYSEDFADPASGWPDGGDNTQEWHYASGEYELSAEPGYYSSALAPGVPTGHGALEVTVRLTAGRQASAGLRFGLRYGFMAFAVTGDGRYELVHRSGGGFRNLVSKTASAAIHSGESNRLRVELDGQTAVLSVNGQRIATVEDSALAEPGRLGLILRNQEQATMRARFDDLVVTRFRADWPRPTAPPLMPSATPTPDGLIYADDFSDPGSRWVISDTATSRTGYVDGEYEMLLRQANINSNRSAPSVRCSTCAIEATIRLPGEVFTEAGVSILESGSGNNRLYAAIDSQGRVALYRRDETLLSALATPAPSPLVRVGRLAANRLRVERRPGRLRFLVNNGQALDQTVETLGEDGRVGLFVINRATPGAYARFDDFAVWRLAGGP